MGCVLLKCSCKHEWQDKEYGKGNRVHNECQGKNKGKANCTVCGKERDAK